jgi:hypothetical protein
VNILGMTLAATASGILLASGALAQVPASLVVPIESEPAPQLDPEGRVFTAQTVRFTSPGK